MNKMLSLAIIIMALSACAGQWQGEAASPSGIPPAWKPSGTDAITPSTSSRPNIVVTGASITGLDTYADNAAAILGGLSAGQLYMTATGTVMVVYSP